MQSVLRPEQPDCPHDYIVWHRPDAELRKKWLVAEDLVLEFMRQLFHGRPPSHELR
jgi:hypothetical protein